MCFSKPLLKRPTRAAFVRTYNRHWRVAEEQGYTLAQFEQVGQVVSTAEPTALQVPKTVQDWSLYEGHPQALEAAEKLGQKLENLLRIARGTPEPTLKEARLIREVMYAEMAQYEKTGARDTESEEILGQTIEAALGLAPGSLLR